ncbi:Hypothetical protein, putative [Bodo saltans]|uniref:Uncharacterized protein n=1 Tax=Bodo saltans TaxID=75058 RepID=A0A0S4JGA6_BODSA|nr:Hypothetical protein, putative [Bodo saltans]|eukprot:CUG89548.1 Hypothetical protein, putative [Bodo saltans]
MVVCQIANMSSKASSRSSSQHSNDSRDSNDRTRDVEEVDAAIRVTTLPEAPDNASQLLLLVLNARAPALADFVSQVGPARCAELCSVEHEHEGKKGTVFYFAARKNERAVLRTLGTGCCGTSPSSPTAQNFNPPSPMNNNSNAAYFPADAATVLAPLVMPAVRKMIEEEKYSVVVFLLSLCPAVSCQLVNAEKGDIILHALCRCPSVPSWCIQDVLALHVGLLPPKGSSDGRSPTPSSFNNTMRSSNHGRSVSPTRAASRAGAAGLSSPAHKARKLPHINQLNAKGLSALHIAATHIKGLAGGEIANMLLRHGADEKLLTPDGKTVLHICLNGHIRAQLGIVRSRHRGIEATLDDEVKQKIDECPNSDAFPVLPDIVEEETPPGGNAGTKAAASEAAAANEDDEGGRKKGDPLSAEDEEALVQRLYDQSIRSKSNWFDGKYREIEELDQQRYHAKQLAADEVEASVARLYQESIDKQAETVSGLNEKYLKERPPGPAIEPEELEAACQRLCQGSLDKKVTIRKELQDKFYPPAERKKLSKSTMADSALRLCTASQEKTAQEMTKLHETYCGGAKGRFNGGNGPLSKDQIKALGDRLSKKA